MGKPAVAQAANPIKHSVGAAAEPDGDGALHRQGVDAGVADFVVAAVVVDHFLRPQHPQHLHLFGAAAAAIAEVFAQSLELHIVPAHADAQAQAAAGQHIHRGGLLGHQGGLALRQDQDAGGQLDFFGQAGQIAEQDKGFVKGVGMAVGTIPLGAAAGVGAQHMVKNQQMFIAQPFGGLDKIAHGGRVVADFGLGENSA